MRPFSSYRCSCIFVLFINILDGVVLGVALPCALPRRGELVSRDTAEPVAWQGFRVGGDADEPAGVAQLGRASAL